MKGVTVKKSQSKKWAISPLAAILVATALVSSVVGRGAAFADDSTPTPTATSTSAPAEATTPATTTAPKSDKTTEPVKAPATTTTPKSTATSTVKAPATTTTPKSTATSTVKPTNNGKLQQVWCNVQGNSGKWKAQIGGKATEHEYPLLVNGSNVFVQSESEVMSSMDATCATLYDEPTTSPTPTPTAPVTSEPPTTSPTPTSQETSEPTTTPFCVNSSGWPDGTLYWIHVDYNGGDDWQEYGLFEGNSSQTVNIDTTDMTSLSVTWRDHNGVVLMDKGPYTSVPSTCIVVTSEPPTTSPTPTPTAPVTSEPPTTSPTPTPTAPVTTEPPSTSPTPTAPVVGSVKLDCKGGSVVLDNSKSTTEIGYELVVSYTDGSFEVYGFVLKAGEKLDLPLPALPAGTMLMLVMSADDTQIASATAPSGCATTVVPPKKPGTKPIFKGHKPSVVGKHNPAKPAKPSTTKSGHKTDKPVVNAGIDTPASAAGSGFNSTAAGIAVFAVFLATLAALALRRHSLFARSGR